MPTGLDKFKQLVLVQMFTSKLQKPSDFHKRFVKRAEIFMKFWDVMNE
jgi:hypothetical protein